MEPAEVPPRVASPTFLPPVSVSTHGGHGARGGRPRADTPPRKAVRVTQSYPILDETIRTPQPVIVPPGGFYPSRRSTGRYPDSETAWHVRDDGEPVRLIAYFPYDKAMPELTVLSGYPQFRERNVGQRLIPTINVATEEFAKATQRGKW